jgi:thioesterase domain-containing protein/acyl carrier protein
MAVFVRELMTAYAAFAAGLPSPLPELPIQYADFAVWQRERLQGEVYDTLRRYWVQRLEGLPALELPTDRPRPAVRTTHGATCMRELPRTLRQAIAELSRRESTTVFMTLLAAFQALLYRYSGQEDFAVSTPVAGRLRPELEGLIGCFLNDLVLRANLEGNPSFREQLALVRETVLQAFDHQEMPFMRLVQELRPPRRPGRCTLVETELILQNTPSASAELPGLELSELECDTQFEAADADLSLVAVEHENGISLRLRYHADLFDQSTAARMLEHFEMVLQAAVADPEVRLTELAFSDVPGPAPSHAASVDCVQPRRARPSYVPPQSDLECHIAAMWAEMLQVERVGLDDDFFALGGDSLLGVRMLLRLREAFSVDLPTATLVSAPTVATLATQIDVHVRQAACSELPATTAAARTAADWSLLPTNSGRSLVLLQPDGNAAPLFCMHGLGGHVASFLPLACGLGNGRPVYGLQAQGLSPGQEPQDSIEAMASCYLKEIRQVQPHGPYALAGWSMGGLIALEAARQLAAAGESVALLAMFDTDLSNSNSDTREVGDQSPLRWIARQLNLPLTELRGIPLERQWQRIAEQADLAGSNDAAEIRRLAAVCQAHLAAVNAYRPGPYQGRAVLFQADAEHCKVDRWWDSLCPELRVERVPGNHYTMLYNPHVDVLAERLGSYLLQPLNGDATERTP